MKYLMILDDGELLVRDQIMDGDYESVMAGILDIVRCNDGNFEQWFDGEWTVIGGEL